jgi:HPt (histidine-containing phosphotransfer) domain-containing protein
MTWTEGADGGDLETDEGILAELIDLMGPDIFADAFATFTMDIDGSVAAMRAAIAATDADAVRRQAHRIKGLLSQFGATGAAAIAQKVEIAPSGPIFAQAKALAAIIPATIGEMRRISAMVLSRS